ncbi:unnamed protein product [Lathyrus sativus]|nr:unnamed protein product [Lathyrus sativus]
MAEAKPQGTVPPQEVPSDTKTSWPELVGVSADEAEKKIKEDLPEAYIQVVPHDQLAVTSDFVFNRVRLFVDEANKVIKTPTIG